MPAPREREPLTDANRHLPETVLRLAGWAARRFSRRCGIDPGRHDELVSEALYGAVLAASDYRPELGKYPSYARHQMFERLKLWRKRGQRYSRRHVPCEPSADWRDTGAEGPGRVVWADSDWAEVRRLLTREEWECVEHVLSGGALKELADRDGQTRAAASARYRRALEKLRESPIIKELADAD